MRIPQRSRRDGQSSDPRTRRGPHRGLRARSFGSRWTARRLLGCLCLWGLGALLLPALALSIVTTRIDPAFVGGSLGAGTTLRLHVRMALSPEPEKLDAIIHLPKGTGLNLTGLTRPDVCGYPTLLQGLSACPKASHIGVGGTATLEAMVGGRPTTVTAPAYPVLVRVHGGTLVIALLITAPKPFNTSAADLVPDRDHHSGYASSDLLAEYSAPEVSPGVWATLTELSVTVGARLKTARGTSPLITMPRSCPRGGFAWRTDLPFERGPETTFATTTPCPPGSKAATASVQPTTTTAQNPTIPPQCKKYAAGSKGRVACIKRATKPGSSCMHPVKAGIAFDHEKNETGVELTDLPVEFPPGGEGMPPAGWADFVMGPATTVMRTDLNYDTIGWKLKTSSVALCRVALYESIPGYFHMHEIPLPNHSQARYNIELVGGYAYGVTLFERYLHPGQREAPHPHTSRAESPPDKMAASGRLPSGASVAAPAFDSLTTETPTAPKTQFECEKAYHSAAGRQRCFDQLPGASCAHPLEAEKAGATTRGAHRYFKLKYSEVIKGNGLPQGGGEQHYSYAPKPNVRMCPYPIGAVYKVSLLSEEERCGPNAKGDEECSSEYDTRNHPEPVGPKGGSFSYYMTNVPLKSWHLVVKGYFIHPPWERKR